MVINKIRKLLIVSLWKKAGPVGFEPTTPSLLLLIEGWCSIYPISCIFLLQSHFQTELQAHIEKDLVFI